MNTYFIEVRHQHFNSWHGELEASRGECSSKLCKRESERERERVAG